MPQPPPTTLSEVPPLTQWKLTRKELDFPIGIGSWIIDVDIQMTWLPLGTKARPPKRQTSLESAQREITEPVSGGVLAGLATAGDHGGVTGSTVETVQAAKDWDWCQFLQSLYSDTKKTLEVSFKLLDWDRSSFRINIHRQLSRLHNFELRDPIPIMLVFVKRTEKEDEADREKRVNHFGSVEMHEKRIKQLLVLFYSMSLSGLIDFCDSHIFWKIIWSVSGSLPLKLY
jgi:hypothetical protein